MLANADEEYVRGVDVRQRMREHYGVSVADHPGGTAGVLAGFTNRYTESFRRELIPGRWVEGNEAHAEFKLGEKYEAEIRRNL